MRMSLKVIYVNDEGDGERVKDDNMEDMGGEAEEASNHDVGSDDASTGIPVYTSRRA